MLTLPKCTRLVECLGRPKSCLLLVLPCLVGLTLYYVAVVDSDYDKIQYLATHTYNASVESNITYADDVDGYLVWNPRCHMLSKHPFDPSIVKLVHREKFESCSSAPLLTAINRESNGSVYLVVNAEAAKHYGAGISCCWAPVVRPSNVIKLTLDMDFDSKISVGQCEEFEDRVALQKGVETVMVSCKTSKQSKSSKSKVKTKSWLSKRTSGNVYENVHAVLNPERVRDRLAAYEARAGANGSVASGTSSTTSTTPPPPCARRDARDLSVLVLGIDSVSRLNFHRAMPLTRDYLAERGWLELRGYNKMGDNTFPNLMAILTGQNQTTAYSKCTPTIPMGLDNCSLIWYNFRDAGYVTAYGEDQSSISTFNYLKTGFVDPPVDYYLRPYILASEKLLKTRQRFGGKYCAGPKLVVDRIFDYAVDFAKAFLGYPYFGFFWTNSVSHESMNGPSAIDRHFLLKLADLEAAGVMNDSMIVFLSDHGMRYGDIRRTFVGWYEERLPVIHVWLPEWFREQEPQAYHAMRLNQNRLTSPYDLYETLRDALARAGGQAPRSTGCPGCSSLFRPVPYVRGCRDAGVAPHWCTCNGFESIDPEDRIVTEGARKVVEHIDDAVKPYKSKKGQRLCAKLRLKKIHRVSRVLDLDRRNSSALVIAYLLETAPGGGLYETTIRYHGPDNYTVRDDEMSRINLYGHSARCLSQGPKQYCQCN